MGAEKWFNSMEAARRNGKPWRLERNSAALLVIDLQNQYVEENSVIEVPQTRETLPAVKKLLNVSRSLGVPVIYTAMVHQSPELVARFYELFPFLKGNAFRPSTREIEIYEEIAPEPGDIVVEKAGYGAFQGTNLDEAIQGLVAPEGRVDTLLLTGTSTNACVESTAREAFDRNYRVVLVSDCCSAAYPDLHAATLKNVAYGFGRVMSADEVIAALEHGDQKDG